MKFYNDYYDIIKSAMSEDQSITLGFDGEISKGIDLKAFLNESKQSNLLPSLQNFASQIGRQPDFSRKLGAHPDFQHLKGTDETENHYIVSMFIDIKGSTNLFSKYSNEAVLIITKTIQRAAIHTCLIFDGYIHRLQGDGLLVYFGGKGVTRKNAVENALLASSMFTYFVKNDLKNLFEEQDIKRIATRIGIDFGGDKDVLWSMAGIGEISEITTCSLHTNLAAKMQLEAETNGIVVGDNIKSNFDTDYYTVVSKRTGDENDRYIFRNPADNFNYTQYDFNWLNFLKEQDFIVTDLNGNLLLKQKPTHIPSTSSLGAIASQNTPYLFIP
ncbi:MAG: hypothetical protein GQ574_04135 [Crocinitomix sp.]|nr:hypothetical protein [Crocinitomix sp.]